LYLQAKDEVKHGGKDPEKQDYWISIPSENLYFFPDKILNMNLTYLPPTGTRADSAAVKNFIEEVLSRSASDLGKVTVSISPEEAPPKT
jgi:hypothetical protein